MALPRVIAGEVACKSSNTQWAFRQLWKKCGVELHQRGLSSVFMTVGNAVTFLHSQFFSESHGSGCRSYHWCRVWDPGQACLDDDACISYDYVVGSPANSCRFYSEATMPENRAAQTCYGHCGPIVKEGSDLTFAWGVYSGFVKLSSKGCGLPLVFFATAQSFRERSLLSVN